MLHDAIVFSPSDSMKILQIPGNYRILPAKSGKSNRLKRALQRLLTVQIAFPSSAVTRSPFSSSARRSF